MAIQERYVATDGDNTDTQGTYDAAVDLAHACSLTVAFKYAAAGDRVNIKNGNKAGESATPAGRWYRTANEPPCYRTSDRLPYYRTEDQPPCYKVISHDD